MFKGFEVNASYLLRGQKSWGLVKVRSQYEKIRVHSC